MGEPVFTNDLVAIAQIREILRDDRIKDFVSPDAVLLYILCNDYGWIAYKPKPRPESTDG